MDLHFLELLLGSVHRSYSRAYSDLNELLVHCGLSDTQILDVIAAIQPMLRAKEDHGVASIAWSSAQFGRTADAELTEAVDEIARRYTR